MFYLRLVIPTVFLLYYSIGFFLFSKILQHNLVQTYVYINNSDISYTYIATLDALSQLGNTNLYCSSKDVIETVASPTLYCKIQGQSCFSLSFLLFSMGLIWNYWVHLYAATIFRACTDWCLGIHETWIAHPHLFDIFQDSLSHTCTQE